MNALTQRERHSS